MEQRDYPRDDFDGPWKEALEIYFEDALRLLIPDLHAAIDWNQEVAFLDKELQSFFPDEGSGKGIVDLLARVMTQKGTPARILLHVEVQGNVDRSFALRMYQYQYKAFDHSGLPVESVAILADLSPSFRPDHFEQVALHTRIRFDFTTVKLLDFEDRVDELGTSDNPFAMFVLAYLRARRNRDGERRYRYKIELVRLLYDRDFDRVDVVQLLRLLDKVIGLPHDLRRPFQHAVTQIEEDRTMTSYGSLEELAMEKYSRRAILTVMETRFGTLPPELSAALEQIEYLDILDGLVRQAVLVEDVETYLTAVRKHVPS
ncbi:MAG: hypothetical protein V2A76_02385 [Planctomycetota bacterium]